MRKTILFVMACAVTLVHVAYGQKGTNGPRNGIWTSRAELAGLPMKGPAWKEVFKDAQKDTSNPDVGNQNDNTNCYVLAAAIVCERLKADGRNEEARTFEEKVIKAIEKIVDTGCPADSRSLAWGREVGAYAMAADLIGYRTRDFEKYLRDAAEKWKCRARKQTLLEMGLNRPNNWGTMAFGSLCAIYTYLGDYEKLKYVRSQWVTALEGPSAKSFVYGKDDSWQADPSNPMVINPKGSIKDGVVIDGLQPEEMRRGAPFNSKTIAPTGYPFEALQGLVMAARILDRQGMSIWECGDNAIYRAVYALEVYLTDNFGKEWSYSGDDMWQLKLVDAAYGSNFSEGKKVWNHGKNAGYPYVALNETSN